MQVVNVNSLFSERLYNLASHMLRFVSRVIQKLNLQQLGGVIDFRHRIHQPFDDEHLVVDGQLNRHGRKLQEGLRVWNGLLVSQVKID
jgi:hypothetical protein